MTQQNTADTNDDNQTAEPPRPEQPRPTTLQTLQTLYTTVGVWVGVTCYCVLLCVPAKIRFPKILNNSSRKCCRPDLLWEYQYGKNKSLQGLL